MDKKNYIKPEITVNEFDSKVLMNSTSSEDDLYLRDRYVTEEEQLGRGRRGKWGDLWYESN